MAYEYSCRDAGMDCDFVVRSENRDETIEMVQQHAREVHSRELSRDDVRDQMQQV